MGDAYALICWYHRSHLEAGIGNVAAYRRFAGMLRVDSHWRIKLDVCCITLNPTSGRISGTHLAR